MPSSPGSGGEIRAAGLLTASLVRTDSAGVSGSRRHRVNGHNAGCATGFNCTGHPRIFFGAAALGVALRRGLRLDRVVFVSSPASIDEHAHNFARLLGITPQVREAMRRRLEHRYGVRFAEIDRIEDLERLRLPALFVHDSGDAEVPFEHAVRLSTRVPGARLIKTYGLGHYRLLREPSVVGAVVDFVAGRVDNLPAELPVLPRPAPIY